MTVCVTTAAQAAAMDQRAIDAGVESFALMRAAGHAAANVIRARCGLSGLRGALIFTGAGNNGGDGWVVAKALADAGVRCEVVEVGAPRTPDAQRARSEAPSVGRRVWPVDVAAILDGSHCVVDGILGTGTSGAPRDELRDAVTAINTLRERGLVVASLDIPSGVDATSGDAPGTSVTADLTVTFGTIKRGLLRNRRAAGAIVAVDIGLGAAADDAAIPRLVDAEVALGRVPAISAGANKGTRRRLLVVGGAAGMAGATVFAARGALRSGAGMVKLCVEQASVVPVQAAVPAALTATWPRDESVLAEYLSWAHAVLLGPGLGLGAPSRELAERVLTAWRGPVVVDADALTLFSGNVGRLAELLKGRPAVITPHAVEAERLAGVSAADLDAGRFEATARLADRVRATVLLKGVPTVVSNGVATEVVAAGTPVLATGGSGDVLGGIVATLLAQMGDPLGAAASGAWVHGRAAELAGGAQVRGVALDDVVDALRAAWLRPPALEAPVIAELPVVPS